MPPVCAEPDYMAAWESVARDIIYVPAQQRYTRAASATNSDRIASMQVRASNTSCFVGNAGEGEGNAHGAGGRSR